VRDLLLGTPPGDLDLAVDGVDPARLAERLGATSVLGHTTFLTAAAVLDGTRVDLAATRSELYSRPGALPQVEPADLATDLARRDFTVNAIAVAVAPAGVGRVVDPYGGVGDLRRRRLRVLHGLSFVEDPTRALRAARFAARLGFWIERRTRRLLSDAVRDGMLDRVSATRIRAEIVRSLSERRPERQLQTLDRLGLLPALVPGLRPAPSTYRRIARCPRVVDRSREGAPGARTWVVILAALAAEGGRLAAAEIIARLEPDRESVDAVGRAPSDVPRLLRVLGRAAAPSRIVRACDGLPDELLLAARAIAGPSRAGKAIDRYLSVLRRVRADVTGHDVLELGVPPGPAVARALTAALGAKLDRGADRAAQIRAARRVLDREKARKGH
jgi:tRNA nucleotidyltransferase (CCA-adding enzyme)